MTDKAPVVAVKVLVPAVDPNVQVVAVAIPEASEATVAGDIDPPPPVTENDTVFPSTKLL